MMIVNWHVTDRPLAVEDLFKIIITIIINMTIYIVP